MRGEHRRKETMFSYVAPEARVPERHPLRAIRAMVDQALTALDAEFEALCSHTGRPSIPPEYLLRATLLQIRKRPAKYTLPPSRCGSDDASQSNEMGAASWHGGSAVGTSGKGWWRVGRVAA